MHTHDSPFRPHLPGLHWFPGTYPRSATSLVVEGAGGIWGPDFLKRRCSENFHSRLSTRPDGGVNFYWQRPHLTIFKSNHLDDRNYDDVALPLASVLDAPLLPHSHSQPWITDVTPAPGSFSMTLAVLSAWA